MLLYVDTNFASPYALAVFVSLLEKGFTFDIETVDLVARAHHGPSFAKTSITQRVPTLVHDGLGIPGDGGDRTRTSGARHLTRVSANRRH